LLTTHPACADLFANYKLPIFHRYEAAASRAPSNLAIETSFYDNLDTLGAVLDCRGSIAAARELCTLLLCQRIVADGANPPLLLAPCSHVLLARKNEVARLDEEGFLPNLNLEPLSCLQHDS